MNISIRAWKNLTLQQKIELLHYRVWNNFSLKQKLILLNFATRH